MTVLGVGVATVNIALRHWLTRKSVDLYGLKWSETTQRRYADITGLVVAPLFIVVWIGLLWFVTPD